MSNCHNKSNGTSSTNLASFSFCIHKVSIFLFHSWAFTTMWWFLCFFNDVILVSMLIYWSLMQIREYFPQFGIFCIFQKKWRAGTTIYPISFWQRTFRNWIKKNQFRIQNWFSRINLQSSHIQETNTEKTK